ncbi:MAG TPA: MaoC/PaaZ C-terminal domain-containing protein [Candidatus Nanopelagicales bacterium]
MSDQPSHQSSDERQPDLPSLTLSIARSAALWKRPATAATVLPEQERQVRGWRVPVDRLAGYRQLLGSSAHLPIAFPQLPVMAMTMDLVSQWSFPVRAMGMVHMGAVVEALGALPVDEPWDLRVWSTSGRHVRAGLEFDVWGEIAVAGEPAWRSRAVYLSRSRPASGAEVSAVPSVAMDAGWPDEQLLDVPEGTGRAFARLTGDINPIHLHGLPARAFGFRRAIAHGWWIAGRVAAVLDLDEAVPGRTLEIAFRKPVDLPSTPTLRSRPEAAGVAFALVSGDGERPLAMGSILG